MLASSAWGEQVAQSLGKDVTSSPTPTLVLIAEAETMLWSLQPGSEQQATTKLLQAWRGAPDDQTRGLALALTAASLVFDPAVEGYLERLTDAYGLALYAGTVDSSNGEGQCARAIVGAAGGGGRQARELVDLVASMSRLPESVRPWLALARGVANDRSQAFVDDATAGLRVRPDAWRLRAMLGERLLELGFIDDAIAAVAVADAPPALALVKARAQVLGGQAAVALPALLALSSQLTGVDEARRSEALYWTAEAQLMTNDLAGAKASAGQLDARPGWQREAALVAGSLALLDGRLPDAQGLLTPLASGTPSSTVPVERRISRLVLDLCAERKDAACLERSVRRLATIDTDTEAVEAARARLARADEVPALTGDRVWLQVVAPTSTTAGLLRARRAIASGVPMLAVRELDMLVKNPSLRAARALRALVKAEPAAQAALAVKALQGAGPPLAESDLLAVIDVLGGAPTAGSEALLQGLERDARVTVSKAATRSLGDLANPQARVARNAPQGDEHKGPGGGPLRPKLPPGMPSP